MMADKVLVQRQLWADVVVAGRQVSEGVGSAWHAWRGALERAAEHWPVLVAMGALLLAFLAFVRFRLLAVIVTRQRRHWPQHRLGETTGALAEMITSGVAMWLAGSLFLQMFVWAAQPEPEVRAMARTLVAVLTLASVIAATGRGLLRVAAFGSLPEGASFALRPVAAVMAASLVAVALVEQSVGLRAMEEAAAGAVRIASIPLLALALAFLLSRSARALSLTTPGDRQRRIHVVRAGLLLGWMVLALVIGSALTGYLALSAFLAKQAVWSVVVLAWWLLLVCLIHDAGDCAVRQKKGLQQWSRRLGIGTRRLSQLVVLATGTATVVVVCLALVLLSAPYGLGPGDLAGRVFDDGGRLRVGNLSFSPLQLVRALFVLAVAVLASRLIARWMSTRLLPTTRLDAGVQASVTALVGYAGVIIGIGLALAALGVEANRITWVVSALTVGIGFGLQAIVQNFISGLILLIERPVKVGDWVVVGDAEGDVRRINVRATEIALPDRTTVLVPNSELITKAVRNRTFTAGEGLVKVLLPVPVVADIAHVVGIVERVVGEQRELMRAPPTQVQVEEIRDNKVWISVSGYVDGPRQVSRIRGELLYALVQRLQSSGIALA